MSEAIQLVVVDLDHTLLNSQHTMSERNEAALKATVAAGIPVILATGKTRSSATALIEKLGLDTPGIFVQGLIVYDGDGTIRHQSSLDSTVARRVITFAEDRGFTVVAYSGGQMLVRRPNQDTDILVRYGEPPPQAVGPLYNILDDTVINKLLIISKDDPKRINALRWQLSMQIEGARLMQAGLPDMLEILPPGASKGSALKALLKEMQIPTERVLAIGDGQNDVEMIQLAGIGVAVENAVPELKAAADHVVASADADGVAEAIEKFILQRPLAAETNPDEQPSNSDEQPNTEENEESRA